MRHDGVLMTVGWHGKGSEFFIIASIAGLMLIVGRAIEDGVLWTIVNLHGAINGKKVCARQLVLAKANTTSIQW